MIPGGVIPLLFAAKTLPAGGATGGTITDIIDVAVNYRVHTFTNSGTFVINQDTTIEYLIVGGGGGASGNLQYAAGGGGGAGGLLYTEKGNGILFQAGVYTITVGSGGAHSLGSQGNNGQNSSIVGSIINLVAIGGGGGGASNPSAAGSAGGSGGGGAYPSKSGGARTVGQGYIGGSGSSNEFGGGGGGALGRGGNASTSASGRGGPGYSIKITGSYVNYAAGGAGGTYTGSTQAIFGGSILPGISPPTNSGSGGGGMSFNPTAYPTDGASGIVVLRYQI